jgi:hypothetical protein
MATAACAAASTVGNMLMLPSPSRPFLDAELLVGLQPRGVAGHVGEHHRDELPLEPFAHAATLLRRGPIL